MKIPGAKLLKIASKLIAFQTVSYYEWTGRVLNDVGEEIDEFAPAINIKGSLQPVPRELYDKYGLEYQKIYYTFYTLEDVKVFERDVNGDHLLFGGKRYDCKESNDWFAQDGWKGVLCVRVN